MNQDNYQEKKQLPRRTSRGVRAQLTEDQKKQDDQVYNRLFGGLDQSSESDSSFGQQLGLRPLQTFTANFANYNYGRGYHYFFNLDTFARVEGSPSYALDDKNRFNYTYSHDDQEIKGTKLKKLLNRHYVGLPTMETTFGNSKSQDKNVCHYHLFNIEDKKYYNHRLISKYKYILNHLDKLCQNGKLKYYTELKKDALLYEVYQKTTPIEKRKQILVNRIKVLEERVRNMATHWDWEDRIYYHFSLDQKFHNQALAKGQRLSLRNLKQRIFKRITSRKQFIQSSEEGSVTLGAQKPKQAIENWLTFEEENKVNALSQQLQLRLKNSIKLIEMFRKKEELITFPLFLFKLGNADRAVDSLLKPKLQKEHESGYYIYKAFIKKLFKRDFSCQENFVSPPILMEEYASIMKRKLQRIEEFYQEKETSKLDQKILIDDIVQVQKIEQSSLDEHVDLLVSNQKVQITLKELMLLFFYRNISIALTEFIDYINCDPEILKLMTDSNYEKYHYGIAKILRQQEFCILLNDIERFAEVLNACDISPEFNETLYFGFNKNLRVANVWVQNESDEWETEKEEDDQEIIEEEQNGADDSMRDAFQNGDPKPSKKVKTD